MNVSFNKYKKPILTACLLMLMAFSTAQSPIADFTATPLSGCAPLAVSFTDLSTGGATSWQWDLGNGTTSTQQNPTTTYFTTGVYTISLTATNANGSNTLIKTQYITVNDKPTVNFVADDTTGCFPLRVNFTDLSNAVSGTITNWEWDFGDGTTSTQQNPFHIYSTAGNRTVVLKVTNSTGCSKVVAKPNYIQVSPGVTVGFLNSPGLRCKAPETISFTNTTTGPGVLTYQWNFGDGNTSTLQNPTNTYLTGGSYTITLIAQSNIGCEDTLIKVNEVVINNFINSITGPDSVCVFSPASFTNSSVPLPVGSNWDFGDGTSTTIQNPTKTWNTAGFYTVRLINGHNTCSDTSYKIVKVLPNPVASFNVADSIDCDAPFTVNFNNTSIGAASWQWNFGDGNTSTLQNPIHTYTANGTYTVTLTVTSASGCTNTFIKTNYIRIQKPVVGINGSPTEGCVPFSFMPTANVTAIDGVASYFWNFGDGNTSTLQNPTNIYPTQGNYTVKLFITTNDGCSDSLVIPNGVVVGNKSIADFSATPTAQCAFQPIQFTNLTSPSDRWLWSFGDLTNSNAANPSKAYTDTGNFTVRLIAWNNGCADTVTKVAYSTSKPSISKFTPGFSCTNKKQVVFTDNSILPQTWAWTFGDGNTSTLQNPTHTYSNFGTYTVTLTTTNGTCSHTETQTITLFTEPANFIAIDDTICKSENALFLAQGVTVANITDFTWTLGDGTIISTGNSPIVGHNYANAGLYSVKLRITDFRGCVDSIVKPNIIRVWGGDANFTPSATAGCKGLTVNFNDLSSTDGTHPITNWVWTYGDGVVQNFTTPPFSHTYTNAGNYAVQLKIIDSYGCTDSTTFATPIFVTDPKAIFTSVNTTSCKGKVVNFNNTSTGVITNYFWSFGDGTTSTLSNPTKVYNTDGIYTIKLFVTDVNGCIDSMIKSNYITVHTTVASFQVNDSISSCSPFEVIFTNTSTYTNNLLWDFGDGSTSNVSPASHYYSSPNVYTAKLISYDAGGCSDTALKTIKLFSSAATLTYSPLAGCSPLQVSFHLSTSGPVNYLWDLNDGNTLLSSDSNLVYNYLLPGDFLPKVILEDQTGCQIPITGIDTIYVTRSNVNFGASDSIFCDNGTVAFTDSSISNATITSYNWNFGDGNSSALQNPIHNYTNPGLYSVRLIVTTINGCSDTLIKSNFIKVQASPIASIGGIFSGCEPSTLTFTGNILNPDTSALTWQWDLGNGNTSNLKNPPSQTYLTAGNNNLQLILTNSTGCADTVQQLVIIHPIPIVNAGNDTVLCLGTPVQLQATGAANYNWTPTNFLSCTNCSNPLTNTPNSITYHVTGTTAFGCFSTDSIFIKVKKPFNISVTPTTDSICIGKSVKLLASPAENYLWSPPLGLSGNTIANPIATPTTTTIYKLLAYDSANCFRDSATSTINVFNYPTVNAGPDKTINAGTTITLSPIYSNDITNWLWQPANTLSGLQCSSCANPSITPYQTTTYTITASNIIGCKTTDKITVHVLCNNSNVFIPNTFTPNGDGLNDYFYPRGVGLYSIRRMEIYNRWGQMIFQNANFTPNSAMEGWNGKLNGKLMPVDSYVYIIEIVCNTSSVLTYKGNITLIQ